MPADPWRCGYCLRTAAHCRRRGASPICDGCRAHLTALGKKFCQYCGQTKPIGQFRRTGQGSERRARCNACFAAAFGEQRRVYMRGYSARNRERRRVYMRGYKARNPERVARDNRNAYINAKIRARKRLRSQQT